MMIFLKKLKSAVLKKEFSKLILLLKMAMRASEQQSTLY